MFIPRKSYASAGIGSLASRLVGAGLDAKAAKAIGDVLGQVLRQQNFDERLNYEAIERGGGAVRSYVYAARTTNQSIANNTPTNLAFDAVYTRNGPEDVTLMASGAMRYNAKGLYIIASGCSWTSNATGNREVVLFGTGFQQTTDRKPAVSGNFTSHVLAMNRSVEIADIGAGSSVSVYQNSGVALNIRADEPCFISIVGFAIP